MILGDVKIKCGGGGEVPSAAEQVFALCSLLVRLTREAVVADTGPQSCLVAEQGWHGGLHSRES